MLMLHQMVHIIVIQEIIGDFILMLVKHLHIGQVNKFQMK